jgi:hypothetical protein
MSAPYPWEGVSSAEYVCKAKEETKTCMTTCYEAANSSSKMFVLACALNRHHTTIFIRNKDLFIQLLLDSSPV